MIARTAVNPAGDASIEALVSLVAAEGEALRQCVSVLNEEQEALMRGKIDDLPGIEARKLALLDTAAARTAAREAELARRKVPATREGMQFLLAGQPRLKSAWDESLNWAKQARDLNRVSGFLIDARLGDNRQALSLLFQPASGSLSTYGRDGHLQHRSSGRALAIG